MIIISKTGLCSAFSRAFDPSSGQLSGQVDHDPLD
jgi:hypothetical protein